MGRKNLAFDYSRYKDWIDPAEVTPYENNAKKHDDRQIRNIANSIRRFGWRRARLFRRAFVLSRAGIQGGLSLNYQDQSG